MHFQARMSIMKDTIYFVMYYSASTGLSVPWPLMCNMTSEEDSLR